MLWGHAVWSMKVTDKGLCCEVMLYDQWRSLTKVYAARSCCKIDEGHWQKFMLWGHAGRSMKVTVKGLCCEINDSHWQRFMLWGHAVRWMKVIDEGLCCEINESNWQRFTLWNQWRYIWQRFVLWNQWQSLTTVYTVRSVKVYNMTKVCAVRSTQDSTAQAWKVTA